MVGRRYWKVDKVNIIIISFSFCYSPVDFCARSPAYPRSLPLTLGYSRSLPRLSKLTPAHSHAYPCSLQLTPVPIRGHSNSLPLTPIHSRSLQLTPAHSCSLPQVLIHEYLRENVKSPSFLLRTSFDYLKPWAQNDSFGCNKPIVFCFLLCWVRLN